MKIKSFAGILPLFLFSGSGLSQEKAPNIVFILTDDMGWKDLGCYGNRFTETPNIDTLADNGIRFTDAYAACPVSSPTRASIMTGKYPARLQLTNFIAGNRTDPTSSVMPANWKPYLEARETTIAELLKEKGYTTGMVGKWHLGGHDSIAPWNQGFDFTRMIGKNGLDYYNYSIYEDSYKKEFIDNGTEYLTDKLTAYGEEFIRSIRGRPFFLYLAYSAPHVVIVPRPDKLMKYFRKYGQFVEKFNPYYSAMVESIDDGVGRIIETLKKEGLIENTLIVFTSDNGGLGLDELGLTPTSNLPLRKWKGHVYEGGIRVPAIISWQGKIKPGMTSADYFSSIDYLPTICEITGINNLPSNVDGRSILPLLFDNANKNEIARPLFWHYPHFSNQMGRPAGAVRLGDYKLVENYETGDLELFNLKDDVSELKDLSKMMEEKTQELYKLLYRWRQTVNAQMPVTNPEYKRVEIPYPASTEITGIKMDWTTHQRHALGSDNFQLTWADDDHQYGIWGDGDGFAGPNPRYRVSFGVARIEGGHDNYRGYDRYGHKESSESEAVIKGKSWGIICLRGNLYAWVHPDKPGGWGNWADHHSEARLHVSKDKGASWQPAEWAFKLEDDLISGNILQFGKNYAGAIDMYVYHYLVQPNIVTDSNNNATELQVPGEIYLLRVPVNKIMRRDAYEFFSGLNGDEPIWTKNVKDKKPVFVDKNGVGTPIGASYNSGLKRYLLSTEHIKPHAGMLGVFESTNPWGPWSTVTYLTNETWFGHDNSEVVPANCFFWCFPTKWISEDGRTATMVFTGGGRGKNNDSFNTIRVKFLVP